MEWSLAPVNIPTIRAPTPTPGVSSAPRVRQALVHAASGISTRDAKQRVLSVDMRPLVIHLLDGLHRAGLERAVVCLGENASAVEHAVPYVVEHAKEMLAKRRLEHQMHRMQAELREAKRAHALSRLALLEKLLLQAVAPEGGCCVCAKGD